MGPLSPGDSFCGDVPCTQHWLEKVTGAKQRGARNSLSCREAKDGGRDLLQHAHLALSRVCVAVRSGGERRDQGGWRSTAARSSGPFSVHVAGNRNRMAKSLARRDE